MEKEFSKRELLSEIVNNFNLNQYNTSKERVWFTSSGLRPVITIKTRSIEVKLIYSNTEFMKPVVMELFVYSRFALKTTGPAPALVLKIAQDLITAYSQALKTKTSNKILK